MLTRYNLKNNKKNLLFKNIETIQKPKLKLKIKCNTLEGSKKRKQGVKKYLASLKNAKFH